MIKYLLLSITLLLSANYAFGCMMSFPHTPDFDKTHYMFIGEVVGIAEALNFKSGEIKKDAVGLKIKVAENIYSPKLASHYEVFPLSLSTYRSLESEAKHLKESYPIGSQVRVVAKQATSIERNPASSIIRLETSIFNKGSISRNDLSAKLRTSAKTIFDYKSFVITDYRTKEEQAFRASNNSLPDFEMRKDLFRLQKSESKTERIKILERLVFYPYVHSFSFQDYLWNLENKDKAQFLTKQWEDRVKKYYSKQR